MDYINRAALARVLLNCNIESATVNANQFLNITAGKLHYSQLFFNKIMIHYDNTVPFDFIKINDKFSPLNKFTKLIPFL